jgi:hypothetical protein
MVSAPTFSKPNLDRLRMGHRAEPTWRFIPGHDVSPLTDRACALHTLADRGYRKALAPLGIAKAIWWPSAPSLNRTLELRSIEGAARRGQPLAENRT